MIKFMNYDGKMQITDEDLIVIIRSYRDKVSFHILDLTVHRLLAAYLSGSIHEDEYNKSYVFSKYIHTLRLTATLGPMYITYDDIKYDVDKYKYNFKLIGFHLIAYLFNGMDTKFNIILADAADISVGQREFYIDVPGTYTRMFIDSYIIYNGSYPDKFTGYRCEKLNTIVPLDNNVIKTISKHKLKASLISSGDNFLWYVDGYYSSKIRLPKDNEVSLYGVNILKDTKNNTIRMLESSTIGDISIDRIKVCLDKVTQISRVKVCNADININDLAIMYNVNLHDSILNIHKGSMLHLFNSKNSCISIDGITSISLVDCVNIQITIKKPMSKIVMSRMFNGRNTFTLCKDITFILDFIDEDCIRYLEECLESFKDIDDIKFYSRYGGYKYIKLLRD